jgi:hypothetical protein
LPAAGIEVFDVAEVVRVIGVSADAFGFPRCACLQAMPVDAQQFIDEAIQAPDVRRLAPHRLNHDLVVLCGGLRAAEKPRNLQRDEERAPRSHPDCILAMHDRSSSTFAASFPA